jgi:hypothetical protein
VAAPLPPSLTDKAQELLQEGERRGQAAIAARDLKPGEAAALKGLAWSVALVIDPARLDAVPNRDFLNTVASANPQYTGWPIWLDSRRFTDQDSRPKIIDKAWQALIISLGGWSQQADFIRLHPKGSFFLWRLLQDDLVPTKVTPGTALDPILVVIKSFRGNRRRYQPSQSFRMGK